MYVLKNPMWLRILNFLETKLGLIFMLSFQYFTVPVKTKESPQKLRRQVTSLGPV